jgi:hypothetical protein
LSERVIDDDLIQKIKHIQALAEQGDRGEAENAAAKLQHLLAKHNITLLDLDTYSDKIGSKVKDQMFWMSSRSNWRRELLNQVSRANYCRMVFYPGSRQVSVIGYEHNIIMAIDTYLWLESIFDDIVAKERDMLKMQNWPRPNQMTGMWQDMNEYFYADRNQRMYEASRRLLLKNRQRWSNSFRFGMVAGIADTMRRDRARASVDARREAIVDKWALVPTMQPVTEADIEAHMKEKMNVTVDNRKIETYQVVTQHGYLVGKKINLSRQIGSGEMAALR